MATQQELKQREQEAWNYAWGINPRYHSFVEAIERRAKDDNGKWVLTYNPYLNVDGMLLAAHDEHSHHGAKLSILPPRFEKTEGGEYDTPVQWDDKNNPTEYKRLKKLGELVIVVGVESDLHGTSYGSAEVDFNAESGAARDYPVRVAETHALGRALDHMGYTFHNPWLRRQTQVPENQAEQDDAQEFASEKMNELAQVIIEKGVSENDAWTALSLIQFATQVEIDREIRHQSGLDKLTPKVFGAMLKANMAENQVTNEQCKTHLAGKATRDLNLAEQLELIEWIKNQKQGEEPSDEVDESVTRMISIYAKQYKTTDEKIAKSLVSYVNSEDDNNYKDIWEIPIETLYELFKDDEAVKKIGEEASNEA